MCLLPMVLVCMLISTLSTTTIRKTIDEEVLNSLQIVAASVNEIETIPMEQKVPEEKKEAVNTNQSTEDKVQTNSGNTSQNTENGKQESSNKTEKPSGNQGQKDEYKLIWTDEFDGTSLNMDDANR